MLPRALSVAIYELLSGTTTPISQPPSNITSYETFFFDNANELEREGTPSRIPRKVTFNTSNDMRSLSPVSNPSTTFSFTTANWQPVNNCWFESNSSNRGNNTIEHQNVTTKGISQSTTSVPSSQSSNNINTSQLILTSQPVIVPVGGNNDNAYFQVIQGLAGWLQGQQTRE
ncbi:16774_t:CDS:2 [Funneliformis caledonium]|uniref:16774_t:CDS:1 n=1 Tax=Funneliformis caledonium TaxID=1117310 RepID=A0A9N9IAY9_9GLOM|nr:16774_t:CDS:2 [Funneliformis caledonium]